MSKFMIRLFILISVLIVGCSSQNNEVNEVPEINPLQDIYSYEYNRIETKHLDDINEWLSKSRADDATPIYYYGINSDQEGYEYVLGKGYKEFEVTFVYSMDDPHSKGWLHITGIKGNKEDEAFIRIKYDTRYIMGMINSDQIIFE